MRAVRVVLVAGFRRQWRSWLLLSLLIAVASGFVLASTAAGRRTDAAFPRYMASHGYDAIVYTVQPFSYGQGVTYDLYPGPGFAVATKGTPALTSYYVRTALAARRRGLRGLRRADRHSAGGAGRDRARRLGDARSAQVAVPADGVRLRADPRGRVRALQPAAG